MSLLSNVFLSFRSIRQKTKPSVNYFRLNAAISFTNIYLDILALNESFEFTSASKNSASRAKKNM